MTRVLVTGATTPLGIRLVEALLSEPRVERVLAAGTTPEPPALAVIDPDRLRYVQVDLEHARQAKSLLFGPAREFEIDTIVHAALHRSAAASGGRARRLDVEATRVLLDAAERHPTVRRFVLRSHADVYRVDPRRPSLVSEDDPLDLSREAPERVRDRVEADLVVTTRMASSRLRLVVLRLAEILAPDCGSQLFDYLESRVCLRPLGFDPMLNVLSLDDAALAFLLAVFCESSGVFNVPGADTLPLSGVIARWGRADVPLPGPLLSPLYRLRRTALGLEFSYDVNLRRFHFGSILDGSRARESLAYRPVKQIAWARRGE